MSVTPPISTFFGLDPRFLGAPAASSSLINPLLYGSSYQMVPINHGGFYSGIPPIFGGQGFNGFPTVPFNMFGGTGGIQSGFGAGGAFGNGYGTYPFGGASQQPICPPMPRPVPICLPVPVMHMPICPPPPPACPPPMRGNFFAGYGNFGFMGGSFGGHQPAYPGMSYSFAA